MSYSIRTSATSFAGSVSVPRLTAALVASLVLALALSPQALAQNPLHSARSESAWDGFGGRLEALGDIDGDGSGDVAVSCVGSDKVRVLSGADGQELFVLHGSGGFGLTLAHGEFDGDGVPDLAVGAPLSRDPRSGHEAGAVFLYSGRDGALISSLHGTDGDNQLGHSLFPLGDLDGGGRDDLLVSGVDSTAQVVLNGNPAQVLRPGRGVRADAGSPWAGIPGPADGEESLARPLGDLDQDGAQDWGLAISPLDADPTGVRLRFSGNPATARVLSSGLLDDCFGWALAAIDDVDGDGVPDVVVGAPGDDTKAIDGGAVHVFSGRTGESVFVVHGVQEGGRLGAAVAGLGDIDGDGRPDLCATAQDGAFGVVRFFASPWLQEVVSPGSGAADGSLMGGD